MHVKNFLFSQCEKENNGMEQTATTWLSSLTASFFHTSAENIVCDYEKVTKQIEIILKHSPRCLLYFKTRCFEFQHILCFGQLNILFVWPTCTGRIVFLPFIKNVRSYMIKIAKETFRKPPSNYLTALIQGFMADQWNLFFLNKVTQPNIIKWPQ